MVLDTLNRQAVFFFQTRECSNRSCSQSLIADSVHYELYFCLIKGKAFIVSEKGTKEESYNRIISVRLVNQITKQK